MASAYELDFEGFRNMVDLLIETIERQSKIIVMLSEKTAIISVTSEPMEGE